MTLLVLWGVYLAANLIAFAAFGIDKRRAIRGQWRIPERTLLLHAFLLGGMGAWLAMRVFRHKTKHGIFQLGVPAAAVMGLALMIVASIRLLS